MIFSQDLRIIGDTIISYSTGIYSVLIFYFSYYNIRKVESNCVIIPVYGRTKDFYLFNRTLLQYKDRIKVYPLVNFSPFEICTTGTEIFNNNVISTCRTFSQDLLEWVEVMYLNTEMLCLKFPYSSRPVTTNAGFLVYTKAQVKVEDVAANVTIIPFLSNKKGDLTTEQFSFDDVANVRTDLIFEVPDNTVDAFALSNILDEMIIDKSYVPPNNLLASSVVLDSSMQGFDLYNNKGELFLARSHYFNKHSHQKYLNYDISKGIPVF